MATKVYDSDTIETVDGIVIYLTPLKIKYLRDFMKEFENVKSSNNDDAATTSLVRCAVASMQQYYPLFKTVEDVEDNFDMPSIYKILEIAGGIKINDDSEDTVKDQAVDSGSSWENLDLAKLEAEVFMLGIWKDYEELETSLSMPELVSTLETKRELDYQEKKFLAAIQGVDLDKESGKANEQDAWEKMKAKVFSGGQATDPNDITALQGYNAQKQGFGIGNGLTYERID